MLLLFPIVFFVSICPATLAATKWHQKKYNHEIATLTDAELKFVSQMSDVSLFNQTLDNIVIPRVPGTKGHGQVRNFIINTMRNLQWDIQEDSFEADTPVGRLPFSNIIATLDPSCDRHLVLACHYDSKLNRERTLVVATDSAVPCSMMINLAQLLDPFLKSRTEFLDVTLRFLFFDGEEAFEQWTATDSLYGSRHLADKMHKEVYPANNIEGTNGLHRMDVMVLLDLLGSKNPSFPMFFADTEWLYQKFVAAETRLNRLQLLSNHRSPYFNAQASFGGIEDDHIPFLARGVPILHVIPVPFPDVWHRETDTKENLDYPTIDNLNKIFRIFVAEYLHLPMIHLPSSGPL